MNREALIIKACEVNNIIKNKKIEINGNVMDISNCLNRDNEISVEYRENDIGKIKINQFPRMSKMCDLVVLDCDSPDAFDTKFENTTLLNFASSKNPGGGFLRGAMAQEESLCQRSNLHSILDKHKDFYNYNRAHLNNALYTDGVIYSSNVCFFRDKDLKNCSPVNINVITSAAPNRGAARRQRVPVEAIQYTMTRRLEEILRVAINHGTEHLILGAFGCGVFHNKPEEVAQDLYGLIISKGYGLYFKQITFAMHDSTSKNSKVFHKVFD